MTRDEEVLWLARKLKYVREVPANRGQRVEAIQKWCGGVAGESWCCDFATMVLDVVFEGKSPVPRTGSCDVVLSLAKSENWLTTAPAKGDLFLLLHDEHDAHHIGFVADALGAPDHFTEISGNTNNDGSSDGNGVYEKPRQIIPGKVVFVRYPRTTPHPSGTP